MRKIFEQYIKKNYPEGWLHAYRYFDGYCVQLEYYRKEGGDTYKTDLTIWNVLEFCANEYVEGDNEKKYS
jgi:hypothetical protein